MVRDNEERSKKNMEYKMTNNKEQSIVKKINVKPIGTSKCQTLREALTKFQELNITALKDTNNEYFRSKYADLTAVINAVNHGAQFGLSFDQAVNYENIPENGKLFLRIADEIGYIKSYVGGYKSFLYAIRVEKK